MKERWETVSFGVGVGLIVIYFIVLRTLSVDIGSVLTALVLALIIAVFMTLPLASFVSEKFSTIFLGERGAKITRDYSKARSLAAQGKFEEAIEEYRQGLENEPDNVMLRLEIAEIYSREMKDFRRAISELEECLKLPLGETQAASILNRIADLYETNLSDPNAALAALGKIVQNWPATKLAHRAQQRMEMLRGGPANLS